MFGVTLISILTTIFNTLFKGRNAMENYRLFLDFHEILLKLKKNKLDNDKFINFVRNKLDNDKYAKFVSYL